MIYRPTIFGISLARRNARRVFLCCYWGFALIFITVPALHPGRIFHPTSLTEIVGVLLLTPFIWATFRLVGIPPGLGLVRDLQDRYSVDGTGDYSPLDERETILRDRAQSLSLRLLRAAFFLGWAFRGTLPEKLAATAGDSGLVVFGLLLWTLPQTIILWTEPDMEPADEGSGEAKHDL